MAVDMTEIKRNSDWYYANQDSLVPKCDGKFIAIIDCAVVGEYGTFANILRWRKRWQNGTGE